MEKSPQWVVSLFSGTVISENRTATPFNFERPSFLVSLANKSILDEGLECFHFIFFVVMFSRSHRLSDNNSMC